MESRWRISVCIAIVAAFFSGCVPSADQPLTDPGITAIDEALLGTWFWNEDAENGFVHIGTNSEGNRLRRLMVTRYRDGELDVAEFVGHRRQYLPQPQSRESGDRRAARVSLPEP